MNAKQRRKANREYPFKFSFDLPYKRGEIESEEDLQQIKKWCKKHCKHDWLATGGWYFGEFKFSSSKDAMMFTLRWS